MLHEVVHPDGGGDDAEGFGVHYQDHPALGVKFGSVFEDVFFGGLEDVHEDALLDGFTEGEFGGRGVGGGRRAAGGGGGEAGGFAGHDDFLCRLLVLFACKLEREHW